MNVALLRAALADQGLRGRQLDDELEAIEFAPFQLPQTLAEEHIPHLIELAERRKLIDVLRLPSVATSEPRQRLLVALKDPHG